MTAQDFEAIQSELTSKLAAALASVLHLLGDEARDVDMVSVKPDLDRYHLSRQHACT